jgi:glutamate dehydrogenase (NAD(P)+)
MAAMEYEKGTEKEAFETISSKIKKNTYLMLENAKREKILPRIAAEKLAREKVLEAIRYREY